MPLAETKNWTPLKITFPVMMSFGDYHEIEGMRHILSTLFNQKLECFELGDGDVEQEKGLGVKLFKHSGDFYVGLFQLKMPPEMYRFPTRDEVWGD
jgi:hypothetical protein